MPPWPARLHLESPSSSKPGPNARSPGLQGLRQAENEKSSVLPEPPLHGVPILPTSRPVGEGGAAIRGYHSRQHSQGLPSEYMSRGEGLYQTEDIGGFRNEPSILAESPSKWGQREQSPLSFAWAGHGEDKDLIAGRCATCDSHMKWPRQLSTFRCSVCLMINDLKPVVESTPWGQNRTEDMARPNTPLPLKSSDGMPTLT